MLPPLVHASCRRWSGGTPQARTGWLSPRHCPRPRRPLHPERHRRGWGCRRTRLCAPCAGRGLVGDALPASFAVRLLRAGLESLVRLRERHSHIKCLGTRHRQYVGLSDVAIVPVELHLCLEACLFKLLLTSAHSPTRYCELQAALHQPCTSGNLRLCVLLPLCIRLRHRPRLLPGHAHTRKCGPRAQAVRRLMNGDAYSFRQGWAAGPVLGRASYLIELGYGCATLPFRNRHSLLLPGFFPFAFIHSSDTSYHLIALAASRHVCHQCA